MICREEAYLSPEELRTRGQFLGTKATMNKPLSMRPTNNSKKRKRFLIVLACVVGINIIQIHLHKWAEEYVDIPSDERANLVDAHRGNAYLAETPLWVQEYAHWHARELALCRTEGNYTRARFLVLSCFPGASCGGTADRLQSLPYLIQVANATRRILLIHWSKHFPLEAFLVPAAVNWSVPEHPTFHESCVGKRIVHLKAQKRRVTITDAREHVMCFKSELNKRSAPALFSTERHPDGTFRQLFHALFRPSPGLARYLRELPLQRTLARGPYLAAHLRAQYPQRAGSIITWLNTTDPAHVRVMHAWADHAVDAVVTLYRTHHGATAPLPPIYVASDTPEAIDFLKKGRAETVYGMAESNKENLEFATAPHASAYFPTFADLLLLGNATCVSHGVGGYGLFAARLANESCLVQHRARVKLPVD